MKYAHPDVLDPALAFIRNNATHALLLPAFTPDTTYSQAVANALIDVPVSAADFTLGSEGAGRKLVFGGGTGTATKSALAGAPLHVAFTDGASRILWVDEEASHRGIAAGQAYTLPALTYLVPQPE